MITWFKGRIKEVVLAANTQRVDLDALDHVGDQVQYLKVKVF